MRLYVHLFCFSVVSLILFITSCDNNYKPPTFADDIAPIIYTNCTPCHRPGEAGPFSLISYNDVLKRIKTIKFAVSTGFMPPWPADRNYTHFVNERFLTKEQIELIINWIDNGAPTGDTVKIKYISPQVNMVINRHPDLVLKMPAPFFLKGNNRDKFYLMKLPYELDRDTFIKAIEFVPGNRKLVHHVNGFIVQYDESKKKNLNVGEWVVDAEEYADRKLAYDKMKIPNDDGTYPMLTPSAFNYLPGMESIIYPEGLGGYFIKKKGYILFRDIHYGPSRVDQWDSSYVNIYFSNTPPVRRTLELQMGTFGVSPIVPPLVVPPDSVKKFITQTQIPIDISVLSINPHMHLLGKSYLAYAITPALDTIRLVKINKWDFRWQYTYTFEKPVKIPAGSVIRVEGVYDNTKNNPNNPFSPPQVIAEREGSMRTTDEMFQFMITYVPYKNGDENISLNTASSK